MTSTYGIETRGKQGSNITRALPSKCRQRKQSWQYLYKEAERRNCMGRLVDVLRWRSVLNSREEEQDLQG
jgi:hypothetical protein